MENVCTLLTRSLIPHVHRVGRRSMSSLPSKDSVSCANKKTLVSTLATSPVTERAIVFSPQILGVDIEPVKPEFRSVIQTISKEDVFLNEQEGHVYARIQVHAGAYPSVIIPESEWRVGSLRYPDLMVHYRFFSRVLNSNTSPALSKYVVHALNLLTPFFPDGRGLITANLKWTDLPESLTPHRDRHDVSLLLPIVAPSFFFGELCLYPKDTDLTLSHVHLNKQVIDTLDDKTAVFIGRHIPHSVKMHFRSQGLEGSRFRSKIDRHTQFDVRAKLALSITELPQRTD